jgi:rubrerythrin
MPSKEAVLWCYNNKDLKQLFEKILNNELSNVIEANKWFEKITEKPAHLASERIWNEINSII